MYDILIDDVYSQGIHYFKTIDTAYYYDLDIKEDVPIGTLQINKKFYDNRKLNTILYYVKYLLFSIKDPRDKKYRLFDSSIKKNKLIEIYRYNDNEYLKSKTKYNIENYNYQHTIYYKKKSLPIILQHNNYLISRIYISNDVFMCDAFGESIEYYINGQIASKINYENGKKNGKWVDYFDNGQLLSEGMYKKGKRVGEWLFYDFYGNVTKKVF